jgi:hypothetical protein
MIAEEGLAELRKSLVTAYRLAQDLRDLQDQDVELGGDVDMHGVRACLWSVIRMVGGEKEAMSCSTR